MQITYSSSTENHGFQNTVVAFKVNDGELEDFRHDASEQLSLYLFFTMIAERCPRGEYLTFFSVPTSATGVMGRIEEYEAANFCKKPKTHRAELIELSKLRRSKDLQWTFQRISDEPKRALDDHIKFIRTGRKKESPLVLRPGDPRENPWSRGREGIDDQIKRAIAKDRRGDA
ncbi:hypothetical protein ACE10W_16760 [Bradyrhizobium sp. B025]|jgi:hypothetical protein|uniref:hypothetical protein n=1 Tax=Bradyrhizobium sp. B025 TaxID=3344829 RepID=UPI0035D3F6BB